MSDASYAITVMDAGQLLRSMNTDYVDMTFCSPPYEKARSYGGGFQTFSGQDWVDWAVPLFEECVRVTRGLVCWVVAGSTQKFRWSATPALLMADLHRRGIRLRDPCIYHRNGIMGSGGPDWWRHDYEFVVCASKGRLPWADPTAVGHPPKFPPGGRPTHRTRSGDRVAGNYKPPTRANPGNVIRCRVGKGHMGSDLAHENEAPFPESLVERFVRCFCPPGGLVLDPFMGSGTVGAVAMKLGRGFVGCDIRDSQFKLTSMRLEGVYSEMNGGVADAGA